MTKKTKLYFIFIVITLIIAIICGVVTKNSFQGHIYLDELEKDKNLDEIALQLFIDDNKYFNNDIENINELEKESDLIVKVRLDGERKLYLQSTKSPVRIIKKYYGSEYYKEGSLIYIEEPSTFVNTIDLSYDVVQGYQLMREDKEYILFLKKLDKAPKYKYKGNEKNTLMPISTLYAKYLLDSENKSEALDKIKVDNGEYSYGDIKEYPIVTYSQDEINKYNELLILVNKRYN